jgi:hypothetical protein
MGEDLAEDDILVNEISPSAGSYIMNLRTGTATRYIKVTGSGPWHFEIKPLLDAR